MIVLKSFVLLMVCGQYAVTPANPVLRVAPVKPPELNAAPQPPPPVHPTENISNAQLYGSESEFPSDNSFHSEILEPIVQLRHELDETDSSPSETGFHFEINGSYLMKTGSENANMNEPYESFGSEFVPGVEVFSENDFSEQVEEFLGSEPKGPGACECYNTTDPEREVECKCSGSEIPDSLDKSVQRIIVFNANMTILKEASFRPYKASLKEIILNNVSALNVIEERTFQNLSFLRTIDIKHAPSLHHLPEKLFDVYLPVLKTIRIVHTGLESVPRFDKLRPVLVILTLIDLEYNLIHRVNSQAVTKVRTNQFLLNNNLIEEIEDHAFEGAQIATLSLKGNRQLRTIHTEAFDGIRSLHELDLSETGISYLPTHGLKDLETLRLQNTYSLKRFPSIYSFEYLKAAWLTYPYHCCAFQFPATHDPEQFAAHERTVALIHSKYCSDTTVRAARAKRDDAHDFGHMVYSPDNATAGHVVPDWGSLEREFAGGGSLEGDGVFHQNTVTISPRMIQVYCGNLSRAARNFTCMPAPDAFNPCEDLMGNWGLRSAVWIVAVAAVVGNLAVLLVLVSARFRMTVPKFLMCNLALADLCMGLYLLMIAIADASSIGAYFNSAIDWQRGPGCQVAGFLTVFASELSIFTLAVITSERWYAITFALHLDKRLRLTTAARIMAVGWAYSIAMAALPLFGTSSYSKTSICLPLENNDVGDMIYLMTLLLVNALAFCLICACYGRIYCAISGHDSAASRSDRTVAKRMALLVFTDFACWSPIAFFGLTALAGYPLINVTHLKILLVFFYPLNSCANPYLYALLTKQYRRDLFTLLSRHGLCTKKAARYKGADVGYSSGNTLPQNCRNTSLAGAGHCVSLDKAEQNNLSKVVKARSGSVDGMGASVKDHRGSPHPLRNSNTRLNLTPDQEMILRRILDLPARSSSPILNIPVDSHF